MEVKLFHQIKSKIYQLIGVNKYYPQLAKDTTVLITGGNTGIGEETAL